jgi:glucose-specific phosphotransferase system IIA component
MLEKLFNKKAKPQSVSIASPLSGIALPLSQVPDEAFSNKMMGDGFAIEPTEGMLVAPFDGKVAHIIDTRHALILEHASGLQLLLHIGINTVGMKGEGFIAKVKTGDTVKMGQVLIAFDPKLIQKAGYPLITPVVIANMELVAEVECHLGAVERGIEQVLTVALQH